MASLQANINFPKNIMLFAMCSLLITHTFSLASTYANSQYTEVFFVSAHGDGSDPKSGSDLHAWSLEHVGLDSNWSNVDAADGKIGPNDCLVIIGGEYALTRPLIPKKSGLPGKPITIAGSNESRPIIDASGQLTGIHIFNKSYITIRHIIVRNAESDNLKIESNGGTSHHISIEDVISERAKRWGFWITSTTVSGEDCDYIYHLNCEARYNGDNGFHVTQNTPNGEGVWYRNCYAHNNGQITNSHGFACYGGSKGTKSSNVHWVGCISAFNRNDALDREGGGFAIDSYCTDNEIVGCYAHHNTGSGILVGLHTNNNTIAYSISAFNEKSGLYSSLGRSIEVLNSVFFGNGLGGTDNNDGIRFGKCQGVRVINTISSKNRGYGILVGNDTTEVFVSHNNLHGNARGRSKGCVPIKAIWTDPYFVEPTLSDFRLRPDSPCIDAGLDVGMQKDFRGLNVYIGAAPDVGAFEMGPEEAYLTAPSNPRFE